MSHKFGKTFLTVLTSAAAVLLTSQFAFAADAIPVGGESYIKVIFAVGAMIGAGLAIGLGAIGAGAGIGNAANGACQAVGRNPGVQGKIMMVMLVGMAMAESIAIYALVIALILLYANPFMRYFLS
jgi:F-type H+-transporting ATPase subunit c